MNVQLLQALGFFGGGFLAAGLIGGITLLVIRSNEKLRSRLDDLLAAKMEDQGESVEKLAQTVENQAQVIDRLRTAVESQGTTLSNILIMLSQRRGDR